MNCGSWRRIEWPAMLQSMGSWSPWGHDLMTKKQYINNNNNPTSTILKAVLKKSLGITTKKTRRWVRYQSGWVMSAWHQLRLASAHQIGDSREPGVYTHTHILTCQDSSTHLGSLFHLRHTTATCPAGYAEVPAWTLVGGIPETELRLHLTPYLLSRVHQSTPQCLSQLLEVWWVRRGTPWQACPTLLLTRVKSGLPESTSPSLGELFVLWQASYMCATSMLAEVEESVLKRQLQRPSIRNWIQVLPRKRYLDRWKIYGHP